MKSAIVVSYCGEVHRVGVDDALVFGRSATLVIDDNPFLHRQLGRFGFAGQLWWLTNLGSAIAIRVIDRSSGSTATVAPGGSMPLMFRSSWVRFDAGPTTYELELEFEGAAPDIPLLAGPAEGETTIDAASLPLTPEQLVLLLALCEPQLRRGRSASLPSNQDIADRFGWTITKFNRKLDGLSAKFARRGVAGLTGSNGRPATARRQALADYAISVGLVSMDQLDLLPGGLLPLVNHLLDPYDPAQRNFKEYLCLNPHNPATSRRPGSTRRSPNFIAMLNR